MRIAKDIQHNPIFFYHKEKQNITIIGTPKEKMLQAIKIFNNSKTNVFKQICQE